MKAIVNGKLYTISHGVINKGTLLVDQGRIVAIGKEISVPSEAEVIDAAGKVVTPGLIDAHSHIGLFGEPMVPANWDGNEDSDPVTPQLRGIDSLNPDDPSFPVVLAAGVTTVYTGPGSGNIIGGIGLAVKMVGRTADEMAIPGTEAMKMALGENPKGLYGERKMMPYTRMGNAAVLREALIKAQNYMRKSQEAEKDKDKPERDLKMEMLCRVLKREMKARIHAHRADDIMTAIRIAEEFDLDFVIEHATEGYRIADLLAQKGVPCVVGPVLMFPSKMELTKVTLENPGLLAKAGVKVAIQCDATSGTRWLGLHTGLAVREGMDEVMALEAITRIAAEIIGVDDHLGTLEPGKQADIAIFTEHPFNTMSLCETVLISGEIVYQRQ